MTDRRRNLRSDIERRSLTINADFLSAFREVKTTVDGIRAQILAMNESVDTMKNRLHRTQAETSTLIHQTNALQNDCKKLEFQQSIARAFNQRLQLTPDEHVVLYGEKGARTQPNVTPEFFASLDRIQQIHSECRQLMQQLPVASDIMEEMQLHQEGALERLYRWTQTHCRSLDSANEATTKLVLEAMRRLQERPVLFKYVLDEYATSRRAVLVRNFIDALTRGPKPIEENSSDFQRYVGDMLAWLHQAIPTERDSLMQLLTLCCDKASTELTAAIQETLASICDGVCHPLRIRVEIVLNASTVAKPLTFVLYNVANLIRFYEQVLTEVVHGGGGQLEECLRDLRVASEQAYLDALAGQVRMLLGGGLEPPRAELTPSPNITRALALLQEILGVANVSSTSSSRQGDIAKIVSTVLDPLIQAVTESASHLPSIDMAVYLLNSLYAMQSTLAMYEYVDERMERLQGQCEAQVDTLTSQQATCLVTQLNLSPIYTILQTKTKVDVASLKQFVDKFKRFMEMPEMLLLPQVVMLQSGNHRQTVQRRSFQVIATIYKQLWEKLDAEAENDGEKAEKLLRFSVEEVNEALVVKQEK